MISEDKRVHDMQKFLIDTTVLINHLRGDEKATKILKGEVLISVVSIVELIQGAENKQSLKNIWHFLSPFEIDWGSREINKVAVDLVNKYFLSNNMRFLDALVAATAIANKLPLITDNMKHYQFIPGIIVLLPQKAPQTVGK